MLGFCFFGFFRVRGFFVLRRRVGVGFGAGFYLVFVGLGVRCLFRLRVLVFRYCGE